MYNNNVIVTALFDINRENSGDGRKIREYLEWFSKTLQLRCDFVVFTEDRFVDFVNEQRSGSDYKTHIVVQKLEEVPFYDEIENIRNTISSVEYKERMLDTYRIECFLPEYNVIQYSKFGWLSHICQEFEYDNYIWMDAGCSRFFGNFNLESNWPDGSKFLPGKLTIQGNQNFANRFGEMVPDEYIWDSNCMLVGTLFGGNKNTILRIKSEIEEIYRRYLNVGCVNNEQIPLAILAKEKNELFNIIVHLDWTHLPLFHLLK
jgi:hypothetical protein